jgi:hypothetical protein
LPLVELFLLKTKQNRTKSLHVREMHQSLYCRKEKLKQQQQLFK